MKRRKKRDEDEGKESSYIAFISNKEALTRQQAEELQCANAPMQDPRIGHCRPRGVPWTKR